MERWYEIQAILSIRLSNIAKMILLPNGEVLQLMGSQDGLAHMVMIDPGDYVLVPYPGDPIYEQGVFIAGGNIYPMPLSGGESVHTHN